MKQERTSPELEALTSPPTRGRGLKQHLERPRGAVLSVAPHAGAWIETLYFSVSHHETPVAPHAGAWIETRGRPGAVRAGGVAPHAGAWIETFLIWMRSGVLKTSPPTRGRGLKPTPLAGYHSESQVAPHAGAWIETCYRHPRGCEQAVAPHAGAWIETRLVSVTPIGEIAEGRPPRGGVD